MTSYTVTWVKSVEDRLVEIWIDAQDKQDVTRATLEIDQTLEFDATLKGEMLSEGLRFLVASPLRVAFLVREEDRVVEVVSVRRI
jgi:hypothetical protein